jgi:hypothetical protein
MTHDCKLIFNKLFEEVKNDNFYRYLALVNRFKEDELASDSISEMLSYWSRFGKRLIFFTGMPHVRCLILASQTQGKCGDPLKL